MIICNGRLVVVPSILLSLATLLVVRLIIIHVGKRPHLKRRDRLSGFLTTPSKVIQGLLSKQKAARHPSGTRMISAWPSGGAERLLGRGLMKHGLCVYLVVIDTFALAA